MGYGALKEIRTISCGCACAQPDECVQLCGSQGACATRAAIQPLFAHAKGRVYPIPAHATQFLAPVDRGPS